MTELPHRFKEDQFKRYEVYINHAIEAYPHAIKCEPKLFNVSKTTFIARLRDAMKSYNDNKWESAINRVKFLEAYPKIQVSERTDGTILIGSKEAIKAWMQLDNVTEKLFHETSDTTLPLTDLSCPTNHKEFLMFLSHKRLLLPRLKLIGLLDGEAELYQQTYDISLDKNPDGSYTLI